MENNERWERAALGLIDMMNAIWGNPEQSEQEKKEFLEGIRKKMNESDNKVKYRDGFYFCPCCSSSVGFPYFYNQCPVCNKELDWTGTECCC